MKMLIITISKISFKNCKILKKIKENDHLKEDSYMNGIFNDGKPDFLSKISNQTKPREVTSARISTKLREFVT
jgi:hypothetical protein